MPPSQLFLILFVFPAGAIFPTAKVITEGMIVVMFWEGFSLPDRVGIILVIVDLLVVSEQGHAWFTFLQAFILICWSTQCTLRYNAWRGPVWLNGLLVLKSWLMWIIR
jgi:hypothetical protein